MSVEPKDREPSLEKIVMEMKMLKNNRLLDMIKQHPNY